MNRFSQVVVLTAACSATFFPRQVCAQFTFASDSAQNYGGAGEPGWTNASDAGTGFGGWGFTDASASTGSFIGDPTNNGIANTNMGTEAFGMFANSSTGGYANRSRGFDVGLGIGDSFTFDWGMNWDSGNAGGAKGFDLRADGTTVFNINNGGTEAITTTGSGTADSTYGTNNMRVTITRTSTGYTFTMVRRSDGTTFSTNISSTSTINNLNFYIGNQQDNNGNRNIYFDNLSITNSGVFSSGGTVTNANTFSGSGALSVGNNTTLVLSGSGNNNYTGATTISNGSTLVFAGAGTSTFASTIGGGTGDVVMSNGSGVVILTNNNTYTGNTTIQAGTLRIGHANALGSTGTLTVSTGGVLQLIDGITFARAITLNSDGISTSGALQNLSGNNTWSGGISNNSGARINASAGLLTISGNITNAANQTLYLGGAGDIAFGGTLTGNLTTGNGALYKDGVGALSLTADNSSALTGLVRILDGTVSIGTAGNIGSGTVEIGGTGVLSTTSNLTRSANLTVTDASSNAVINVASGTTLTQTGAFTGAANANTKIGKNGAGSLVFNAASGTTYGGQLQIGQGGVVAGTTGALGTNVSTANRGVDLGLNVGDVSQSNNVALLASNGVTVGQSVYVAPNTSSALRTIGLSGSGSATFNNEFYMDGTLTVDAGSIATDSVTMSGNILHVGGLSKTNAGVLVLSGSSNTFSGGVTLGQGTLRVGNNSALGTGTFIINVGTFFASDGSTARVITNNVTMGGNATLGDSTGTGALTLSNISLNGTTRILTVSNNTTVVGVISNGSGNPGLTKAGLGTLTLSGANTYSGTTTISAGVLVITNGSAINNAGAVSLANAANAVFAVNSSETIGSLRGGGSSGGNVSIASGQTLTVAETGSQTFAGRITNAGTLAKSGAGTTTLTGANSYSGGTVVSGGRLVGSTTSLRGAITNTAAVTFNQTTNGSFTNLISGAGGTLTKSGTGTVTFTADNTYTGATTVGGGRLIVNGSQASSAVTVSNGASLGGSGTVGALTVSGLVAPGNSIGTLSAGNTVFDGGGSLELEIFDWVSTAGTGWDLLAVAGNLTLSNTSGSPFAINLVSLTNSTTPGFSTDWNPNVNFTNTFVTYSGSLLGTPFASSLFTVNTGSFSNTINGTFSITNVGNGLALLYTTAFAPTSSFYNWNAGSGLWGAAGNWTNGFAPTNGSSIIFSGAGGSSTNSSTVSSILGIVFTNTAGAYTVSGTPLAVGNSGISNASSAAQTISNNLSLSANSAITAAAGNITLAGNLTNGGNAVTVGGSANTTIGGVISGVGSLTKQGAGSLLLSGANSYGGTTTISAGTVTAANNTALGVTNGGTTVEDGATLQLSGGITTAESITITGSGVGNGGAIRSLGDGENTISGNITLGGNARINVDAPIGSVSTLASLGSSSFTVSSEFSAIPYTQTSTNLTLISATAGETLAGQFGTIYDWTSVSSFGLRMRVGGSNPDLPFEILFYDSAFNELERYEATTEGLTSTASIMALTLLNSTSDPSAVEWLEFKWNGDQATVSVSLLDVVSIPTSGLLVSGDINGGANVLTVGSATGTSGTVADGLRLTGVISGSGGTYGGTATSLVKDGGGTVYLSGNNTFTGDVRILDGILNVIFGAWTNSLGVDSDLFVSSLGTLKVDSNLTVSSFQGAGEGDAGNVQLTGGSFLTVNGAGKTMTMAGDITGFGGLRVAGNSSTLVTLTGDNTYSQATTITAGTLALAGTGGDRALRSTRSLTISGSDAKLLLSTSDQVNDFAGVTLSGGTIQRGSGVSEVFGNLNITGGSTLDFGLGAGGRLRFQTYSYTGSALVEVQNFLVGNSLQFLSSSFNAGNLSQFDFNGLGYTTGFDGSYFTITAIPEPSTYAAAVGLIAFMLWSARRRSASAVKKKS